MPLYEYLCEACNNRFEVIQKFSDTVETCRVCGKGPVQRLQSSPAIQFKGSGFYITDYPKKGPSDSAAAKSAEAKGDSKPEAGTTTSATSSKSDSASASKPTPATSSKE